MDNNKIKAKASDMTLSQYQKRYRENNPQKAVQWRINQAVNLLRKNGYTVINPNGFIVIDPNGKDNVDLES